MIAGKLRKAQTGLVKKLIIYETHFASRRIISEAICKESVIVYKQRSRSAF